MSALADPLDRALGEWDEWDLSALVGRRVQTVDQPSAEPFQYPPETENECHINVVNRDPDLDPDVDGGQFPITTGFSGTEKGGLDPEDGLPAAHLGALLRRYKKGSLRSDFEVPLDLSRVPRQAASLRSLAAWMRLCFELRLTDCETGPMGFSLSLVCTLMGWPNDANHQRRASRDLHKLEERGVIVCATTVKVRGRGTPMRCFLPVGIDLDAILDGGADA
jgi:hypothetical protein